MTSTLDRDGVVLACLQDFWAQQQHCPIRARNKLLAALCPQIHGLFLVKLVGGVHHGYEPPAASTGARYAVTRQYASASLLSRVCCRNVFLGHLPQHLNTPAMHTSHTLQATALCLVGGVPRSNNDGSHIRGDVHLLLIGDPGTGECLPTYMLPDCTAPVRN